MDKILLLVDSCCFDGAKELIQKEFDELEDTKKGWELKLAKIYLDVKVQEQNCNLNTEYVTRAIDHMFGVLNEMQAFQVEVNVFSLEIIALSNILTMSNSIQKLGSAERNHILVKYIDIVKRGARLYWNDTSCLPLIRDNDTSIEMLIHVSRTLLQFMCRNGGNFTLNSYFGNMLSNLLIFLLKVDEKHNGDIMSHTLEAFGSCVAKLKNGHRNGATKNFILNFACNTDLEERFDSLKHLIVTFHIGKQFNGAERKNAFVMLLKGVHLLQIKQYDECYRHINDLLHSTILSSKLSHFQYILTKNIELIAGAILKHPTQGLHIDQLEHPSPHTKVVWLVNKATLALHQQSHEICINTLRSVLGMSTDCAQNERQLFVSNYGYHLDIVLENIICKYIPHVSFDGNLKLYLHIDKYPEPYIRYLLSTEYMKTKRYDDAMRNYEKIIFQSPTPDADLFSTVARSECIERYIYCLLKTSGEQKALDILKENTVYSRHVWYHMYIAEVQRRSKLFPQALQSLERALALTEDLTVEVGNDPSINSKVFLECHIYNNWCVVNMDMGKHMKAFQFMKSAIQYCQQHKVEVFREVVHNYCKWLAEYKSRDTALLNWSDFCKKRSPTVKFHSDEEYKVYL